MTDLLCLGARSSYPYLSYTLDGERYALALGEMAWRNCASLHGDWCEADLEALERAARALLGEPVVRTLRLGLV